MADIDVSFLATDPDFCDQLTLIRRSGEYGDDGYAISNTSQTQIIASVQPIRDDSVTPESGGQGLKTDAKIVLYTKTILRSSGDNGVLPDQVIWLDRTYEVTDVESNYSHAGGGWVKAAAVLVDEGQQP